MAGYCRRRQTTGDHRGRTPAAFPLHPPLPSGEPPVSRSARAARMLGLAAVLVLLFLVLLA